MGRKLLIRKKDLTKPTIKRWVYFNQNDKSNLKMIFWIQESSRNKYMNTIHRRIYKQLKQNRQVVSKNR